MSDHISKMSVTTIRGAANGNSNCVVAILKHYDSYIWKVIKQKTNTFPLSQKREMEKDCKSHIILGLMQAVKKFSVDKDDRDIKNQFHALVITVIKRSATRFCLNTSKITDSETSLDEKLDDNGEKKFSEPYRVDNYEFEKKSYNVFGNQIRIDLTLSDALLSLTEEKRIIILAKVVLKMTDEQISQQMGTPRRTVNDKGNKAIAELRKYLDKHSDI